MSLKRCLCCGQTLNDEESYYHKRCAKKLFSSPQIPALNYSLEELNELAKNTLLNRISVPGVQPKLSLHLERTEQTCPPRLTLVGLAGDYILKPPSAQWAHLPESEHFCMTLAQLCKIETATFGLIPLQSGELAYITRRMDRDHGKLFHMEDFCQILNKMTALKYQGSMEQIGKALRQYSIVPGLDCMRYFEVALYSFITGNSDMHLKNFSLLQREPNRWELSPAYDLVPVKVILPQDSEEMALTMNGKKNRLKRGDFEALGASLQLTPIQIQRTIQRITQAIETRLTEALNRSFLPQEMQASIKTLIVRHLQRLA